MANGEVRLVSKFGSSTTYQWNFGDGSIGSGPDPYHTYKNNGNYTVTLTATGPGGQSTSYKTVQINNISTTGQGIIYLTRNGLGTVDVYIGGSYEGRITVYYSSSTPDCGDNGNVTINKTAGVYNVTAKAVNGSAQWGGTITISNGKCSKLGLN
ncbi:PKD domain-containing protein [Siphonobacter sp. SORGH_AS_0500]|uniref:PKD domain-containing protein n=1 Tax=Siphonobacter sp. SORGH_AS_0500 TaxID=1864824 RepID=UPI00285A4300|nr:PKD domain-containing protein [Siphonobacter sp. SORGH_AS_0500]MDR6195956.1 PKD repeat protein [Siphonobacter sp. SORGH_AS_0500]